LAQRGMIAVRRAFRGILQVLQKMPVVGNLYSLSGALRRALGIGPVRSRLMIGYRFSQAAKVSVFRSGSISMEQCRSRSTRTVP
jgi:hypothetical protein